jgi:hypothetical protein
MDDNALEIIEWLASDECHELDGAGLIDGYRLCIQQSWNAQ